MQRTDFQTVASKEKMMIKFCAFVGNQKRARVTPFFETQQEAVEAARKAGHKESWIRSVSNWQDHQRWNIQRVGMYKTAPVAE